MADTSHEIKMVAILNAQQFPILLRHATPHRAKCFLEAIERVNAGLIKQEIPNPVFKDAKEAVSRLVDDVYDKHVCDPYFWSGRWEQQPQDVQDLHNSILIMGLHECKAATKKVNASKATGEAVTAMRQFFDEVAPLIRAFDALKTMVIKRKTLSDEERETRDRFVPQPSSSGAILAVQKVLQDVTEKQFNALVDYFERDYARNVSRYMAADKAERQRIMRNPAWREGVFEAGSDDYGRSPYVLRDNHQEVLHKMAVESAKGIQDHFVNKNLKKLCSIVEAKGDFDRVEIVGSHVSLSGLEGSFLVRFKDGAQFKASNSVVWSTSVYGKRFQRFPLTFHDVILSGGERMPKPSEERMNTIFAVSSAPGEVAGAAPARNKSTSLGMG